MADAETKIRPTDEELRERIREVKDPEIDMSIVDLGLVYDIEWDDGTVNVKMTLTSRAVRSGRSSGAGSTPK